MIASPLISVLIVSHNAGSYLAEAVQSIVAQTHTRWEIILVDNASDDGSVAPVAARHAADPRFKLITSPRNLGPSGGACAGLSACLGDYIARLDADDVARPDRLALQLALLETRPDLVAVGADVLCMDDRGRALHPRISIRSAFLRRHGSAWESACVHSTLFFRRSATAERFYNPSMTVCEDVEWIQWLARDNRLGLIAAPLVRFRVHSTSLTKTQNTFHTLAGAEIRLQLSRTTRETRIALATRDFSPLKTDPRLALRQREQAAGFLRDALADKNFLAAAYFCTTSGHWLRFPELLLRALIHGRPWREVLGLFLIRTAWPAWKRIYVRLWRAGLTPRR